MGESIKARTIKIGDITCSACENKIEKALMDLDGVVKVKVSYATSAATVFYDPNKVEINSIYNRIEKKGYTVILKGENAKSLKGKTDSNFSLVAMFIILIGLYVIINNTIGFNFFPQVSENMGYSMVFITGLFTSVHCIAMCGGINISQCAGCKGKSTYSKLQPSLFYNLGRVISYTLLGGVVGSLGTVISISIKGKALISLIAAFFMLIMGINMLGITKSFRRLMPRIPKALAFKIEKTKTGRSPFVVGFLNGFMPCGPLQAMQLYALSTGSFFGGAFSMFLFSIGTVPLMFVFGAFSSIISSSFTKNIMKVSAMLVIILGVVMGNRAFAIAGISIGDNLKTSLGISTGENNMVQKATVKNGYQRVETSLESGRYKPIKVQVGIPLKWTIKAKKENLNGCNNEIIIPDYGIQKKLNEGETIIEFTPKRSGVITYTCWMGMINSKITVE